MTWLYELPNSLPAEKIAVGFMLAVDMKYHRHAMLFATQYCKLRLGWSPERLHDSRAYKCPGHHHQRLMAATLSKRKLIFSGS
jgi:hypothetical protein